MQNQVIAFPAPPEKPEDPRPRGSAVLDRRRRQSLVVCSFRTSEEREAEARKVAKVLGISFSLMVDNIMGQALVMHKAGRRGENREDRTRALVGELDRLWKVA